jgi:hypothetical protein
MSACRVNEHELSIAPSELVKFLFSGGDVFLPVRLDPFERVYRLHRRGAGNPAPGFRILLRVNGIVSAISRASHHFPSAQ